MRTQAHSRDFQFQAWALTHAPSPDITVTIDQCDLQATSLGINYLCEKSIELSVTDVGYPASIGIHGVMIDGAHGLDWTDTTVLRHVQHSRWQFCCYSWFRCCQWDCGACLQCWHGREEWDCQGWNVWIWEDIQCDALAPWAYRLENSSSLMCPIHSRPRDWTGTHRFR